MNEGKVRKSTASPLQTTAESHVAGTVSHAIEGEC